MTGNKLELLLESHVHPFGLWQFLLLIYVAFPAEIPVSWVSQLANLSPNFVCSAPYLHNYTYTDILDLYMSISTLTGRNSTPSDFRCHRFNLSPLLPTFEAWNNLSKLQLTSTLVTAASEGNVSMERCKSGPWTYDPESAQYRRSLIEGFNLVCDRQDLVPFSSAWYSVGLFFGYALGGQLADRFGRKTVLSITMPLYGVTSIVIFWSGRFWIFILLRVCNAIFNSMAYVTSFIYVFEFTNHKHRNTLAVLRGAVLGPLTKFCLVGLSYLLQDWRWVHASCGFIILTSVFYCLVLPESPRWLIDRGRYDDAVKVLKSGARINRQSKEIVDSITVDSIRSVLEPHERQIKPANQTIGLKLLVSFKDWIQFLCNRHTARLLLPLSYIRMTQMGSYFGISFSSVRLAWNPYIIATLMTVVAVPTQGSTGILLKLFERKKSLVGLFLLVSLTGLTVFGLQVSSTGEKVVIGLAMMMVGLLATLGDILIVFTTELFETDRRTKALGFLNAMAGLGMFVGFFIERLDVSAWQPLPMLLTSCFLFLSAVSCLTLPERDVMSTNVEAKVRDEKGEIEAEATRL